MEPLKRVQVEGQLLFTEPQDLFGNLDDLCLVSWHARWWFICEWRTGHCCHDDSDNDDACNVQMSYTFCKDFISMLPGDFGKTEALIKALQRVCFLDHKVIAWQFSIVHVINAPWTPQLTKESQTLGFQGQIYIKMVICWTYDKLTHYITYTILLLLLLLFCVVS